MDSDDLRAQLGKALEAMSDHWPRQTNLSDDLTRFIYSTHSFDELETIIGQLDLEEDVRQYAIHRWFNRETSEFCEDRFVEYGAERASTESNIVGHTDCIIRGIPFDIKISVYPAKLPYRGESCLERRRDRDELIRWFYANQSSQQRNCFNNRIFIVCCGNDPHQRNRMKTDLTQIDLKVEAFLSEYLARVPEPHRVNVVSGDGSSRDVFSEVIVIKPGSTSLLSRPGMMRCGSCGGRMYMSVAMHPVYEGNIIMRCAGCRGYRNI